VLMISVLGPTTAPDPAAGPEPMIKAPEACRSGVVRNGSIPGPPLMRGGSGSRTEPWARCLTPPLLMISGSGPGTAPDPAARTQSLIISPGVPAEPA